MLASVAVLGLTTLLALQFDRGTADEKAMMFGQPNFKATITAPLAAPTPATQPKPSRTIEPAQSRTTAASPAPEAPPAPSVALVTPGIAAPMAPAHVAATSSEQGAPSDSLQPSQHARQKAAADAVAQTPSDRASKQSQPEPERQALANQQASVGREEAAEPLAKPTQLRQPAQAPAADAVLAAPAAPAAPALESAPQSLSRVAPSTATAPSAKNSAMPSSMSDALKGHLQDPATALQAAASAGDVALFERLLNARQKSLSASVGSTTNISASINAPDAAGHTYLILATQGGHAALVQRLLALGANRQLKDKQGLTALQYAQQAGWQPIVTLLEAPP